MPGPTIRTRLACTKCGYDLESLEAKAKCPECGQDIVATLAARLDPATESLARTKALTRVAWAVYLACLGSVLGCAIAVAPIAGVAADSKEFPDWIEPVLQGMRSVAPAVAALGCAVGLIGLALVLPWQRRRAVLRARAIGGAGFVCWLVLALRPANFDSALAALGAVAAVVAALTPLLRELVPYSRIYRSARHATQTTRDLLIAAAATLGTGILSLHLHRSEPQEDQLALLASVASLASAMFLLVGLFYRLANAHWALLSVRRPPPRVDDILD